MDNISFMIKVNTLRDKLDDIWVAHEDGKLNLDEAEEQLKSVARVILLEDKIKEPEDPFSFENVSKEMKKINKSLYGI